MDQNRDVEFIESTPVTTVATLLASNSPNERDVSKKYRFTPKRIFLVALFILFAAILIYPRIRIQSVGSPLTGYAATGVLPGEFENHDALLIYWPNENDSYLPDESHLTIQENPDGTNMGYLESLDQLLINIVAATYRNVQTLCMVSSQQAEHRAAALLRKANVPINRVQFVQVPSPVDLWTRDYGPKILKAFDGSYLAVDTNYFKQYSRLPGSEFVPTFLANVFNMKTVHAPIQFEGGNLLSNGAGLCLTTEKAIEWNTPQYKKPELTELIKKHFGATDLIYLEPLEGEATGHVDMFATFTAPDTVVIGECSPREDPVNSAILDRNAQRLAGVRTACGPLHVVRIPVSQTNTPPYEYFPDGYVWHSYTNVVYANQVLLFPIYSDADPKRQEQAMNVYRRLLPGWKIIGVEADVLARGMASLHCVTLNLYRIGKG